MLKKELSHLPCLYVVCNEAIFAEFEIDCIVTNINDSFRHRQWDNSPVKLSIKYLKLHQNFNIKEL